MFAFAILIGVYSYSLFILGITQLLYPQIVLILSILWLISVAVWFRKEIKNIPSATGKSIQLLRKKNNVFKVSIFLVCVIWLINSIGILMPETSFDALWYHLTIPKIFLNNNSIFYIPGGHFYYSLMPKLVDLLFIPAILLESEFLAKAIHYLFGLLICITLYKISKFYVKSIIAIGVVLLFSSNLVVSWLSSAAYIDLGRTFFELMALYGIILFVHEKKKLWIIESAVMMGFAIATKLLAVVSLPILLVFLWRSLQTSPSQKTMELVKYGIIAISIPLPYFLFAFLNTGNPFYPLFTEYYSQVLESSLLPLTIIKDLWNTFVVSPDPINPLYIITIPLIYFAWRKYKSQEKTIVFLSMIACVLWLITPRTGGGRFLLPYLPLFSLLAGITYTKLDTPRIKKIYVCIILILALTTIGYRGIALYTNKEYLLRDESKSEYLTNNLNFSYGDFYDVDGYLEKLISDDDTVLVYGIHNLYYTNFNFIHESYVKRGDEFNYILTAEDTILPERFYAWKEVYRNSTSRIVVYSQGENIWVY
jgi:hypothetical protein